jgi:RecA-family ATPase
VLYLNPELIRQEYLIRLQAIAKELNVDTNHNFRSITLYRTDLGPSKILESLGRCLDKDGFEVIIIDSIYRLYTDDVDENSNSDVARFLGEVNKMAAKSGASVIFSHHSTKGDSSGKDSIDIASGAGSFGRWVDTAISTLRVGEEGDNKYCMKFNVRYF